MDTSRLAPPTLSSMPGLGMGVGIGGLNNGSSTSSPYAMPMRSGNIGTPLSGGAYPSYQRGTYTTLLRNINDEINASRTTASLRAASSGRSPMAGAGGATYLASSPSFDFTSTGAAAHSNPAAVAASSSMSIPSAKERAIDFELQTLMAQQQAEEREAERRRAAASNEAERMRMLEAAKEIELQRQRHQEAAAERILQKERELEEWKMNQMKVRDQERLQKLAEEERQRQLNHEREMARLREAQQIAQATAAAQAQAQAQAAAAATSSSAAAASALALGAVQIPQQQQQQQLTNSPSSFAAASQHYEQMLERITRDMRDREERSAEESKRRERDLANRLEEAEHRRAAEMAELKREMERERTRHEEVQRRLEKISSEQMLQHQLTLSSSTTNATAASAGVGSGSSGSEAALQQQIQQLQKQLQQEQQDSLTALNRAKQLYEDEKIQIDRRHKSEVEQIQLEFNRNKVQLEDQSRTEIRRRDDQIFELERKNRALNEQLSESERKLAAAAANSLTSPANAFLGTPTASLSRGGGHEYEEVNRLRDEVRQMTKQRDEEASGRKALQSKVEDLTQRCEALTRAQQTAMNDVRTKEQQHYDEVRKLRDERDTLERDLNREKHSVSNTVADAERVKRDALDSLRRELESASEQSLRKANLHAEDERRRLEREKLELTDRLSVLEREKSAIQSSITKREADAAETLKKAEESHKAELNRQVAAAAETSSKLSNVEAEVRELRSKLADVTKSSERASEALAALKTEKEAAEATHRTQLEAKTREVSEAQQKLAAALDQSNTSTNYNSEMQNLLQQKDKELQEIISQVRDAHTGKARALDQLTAEKHALEDTRRKLGEALTEIARLNTSLNEAKNAAVVAVQSTANNSFGGAAGPQSVQEPIMSNTNYDTNSNAMIGRGSAAATPSASIISRTQHMNIEQPQSAVPQQHAAAAMGGELHSHHHHHHQQQQHHQQQHPALATSIVSPVSASGGNPLGMSLVGAAASVTSPSTAHHSPQNILTNTGTGGFFSPAHGGAGSEGGNAASMSSAQASSMASPFISSTSQTVGVVAGSGAGAAEASTPSTATNTNAFNPSDLAREPSTQFGSMNMVSAMMMGGGGNQNFPHQEGAGVLTPSNANPMVAPTPTVAPAPPAAVVRSVSNSHAPDLSSIPVPGSSTPAAPTTSVVTTSNSQAPDLSSVPIPGASSSVPTVIVAMPSPPPQSTVQHVGGAPLMPTPVPVPTPVPGVAPISSSIPATYSSSQGPDLAKIPVPGGSQSPTPAAVVRSVSNSHAPDLSSIPVPGSSTPAAPTTSVVATSNSQAPDLSSVPIPGASSSVPLASVQPSVNTSIVNYSLAEANGPTTSTTTPTATVVTTSASYQPNLGAIPIPPPASSPTANTNNPANSPANNPASLVAVSSSSSTPATTTTEDKVYYLYTNMKDGKQAVVQGPRGTNYPGMVLLTPQNAPPGFDISLLGPSSGPVGTTQASPASPLASTSNTAKVEKDLKEREREKDKERKDRDKDRDRRDRSKDRDDRRDRDRERDRDKDSSRRDRDRDRDREKDKDSRRGERDRDRSRERDRSRDRKRDKR